MRKSLPESTPRPGLGKGHLLLGMKGPRPLLLTSTRMTTLPFLMGMGVYQLMTHISSAVHCSAGRHWTLRLLAPPRGTPQATVHGDLPGPPHAPL